MSILSEWPTIRPEFPQAPRNSPAPAIAQAPERIVQSVERQAQRREANTERVLSLKGAPLRRITNRQPADGLAELLRSLAFDKQQEGVLGLAGPSHLFERCVNRHCISLTGNDWRQ